MRQTTLYLTYSTIVFRRYLLSPTPLTMEDTLPEKLSNLFVLQLISRGVGMQNFKCKALSITASDQPSPACVVWVVMQTVRSLDERQPHPCIEQALPLVLFHVLFHFIHITAL